MNPYRVSVVNYLNSAPFVEGLTGSADLPVSLSLDNPSESARKLIHGEADISLAPVAILKSLPEAHIISDYCIGTTGEVATVKIFSDLPIEETDRILLDYQSRTSFQLVKILCRQYWKITPDLIPAYSGFQKDIVGTTAGLVIGDRAIRLLGHYKYEYDLGEAWVRMTGLPFVFAAWISAVEVDPEWQRSFNMALKNGLDSMDKVIQKYSHMENQWFSVDRYFLENISYNLDEQKRKAMQLFLSLTDNG